MLQEKNWALVALTSLSEVRYELYKHHFHNRWINGAGDFKEYGSLQVRKSLEILSDQRQRILPSSAFLYLHDITQPSCMQRGVQKGHFIHRGQCTNQQGALEMKPNPSLGQVPHGYIDHFKGTFWQIVVACMKSCPRNHFVPFSNKHLLE